MASQQETIGTTTGKVLLRNDEYFVTRRQEFTPEEIEKIWNIIQDGFKAVNEKSLHDQDMSQEEYLADINNPKVLKYILMNPLGQITGYLSAHLGLENVGWVDRPRIAEYQNKVDRTAEPFYISTFVVPPDARGMQLGGLLLKAALQEMLSIYTTTGKNGVAFFDCADVNIPLIPNYAEKIASQVGHPDYKLVIAKLFEERTEKDGVSETQHYFSITITNA